MIRIRLAAVVAAAFAAAAPAALAGDGGGAGFHTTEPAMLEGVAPGVEVTPIVTVAVEDNVPSVTRNVKASGPE